MRRRQFIGMLGSLALSLPNNARAQHADRTRRVGVILALAEDDPEAQSRIQAFRFGLRDLDWLEGRNIRVDYRYSTGDPLQIKEQAKELVSLAPDVIVVNGTPVLAELRQATTSIPIVFSIVNDPMGQGFVSSISHPGGNITGFSFIDFPIIGKWVGLLKDVSPNLSRVALMFDPDTLPYYDVYLRSLERLPRPIGVEISAAPVRNDTEIEQIIAGLGRERGTGLIAASDLFVINHREAVLRSVKTHGVPTLSPYRQFVREGFLMSYGPDTADIFRRAASYVDRILRGEKAADLPVQSPIRFELAINMTAAKALGLTIHDSFSMLADEVIE
jgi:putative tryptophan/tyrosine transport system substrate-binding protein